jgi:ABC-type multidrug transport system ATPase subunit
LLERFALTVAARRPVATYSGGMRRRLDLAASLVGRPRVIFLDEPTTGLDLPSRQAMWEIVTELAADGVTIFLTTQYLEEADKLADRIAVLNGGLLVAEGSAAQVRELLDELDPAGNWCGTSPYTAPASMTPSSPSPRARPSPRAQPLTRNWETADA